jgi:gas vesicle protein
MVRESRVYISERFKDQALKLSMNNLEQKIAEAKLKQIDALNALGITLDMERALLEKNFFESYESDSAEFKQQIKGMNNSVRLHIKRVESEINALKEKIAEEEKKKQGEKPLGNSTFLS